MSKHEFFIELHGTGVHNRGAELMAIATADRLRNRYPDVKIVVPPQFGPPSALEKYQFFTTREKVGRLSLVPNLVNLIFGGASPSVIKPNRVCLVLDASGFAFSDQWGAGQAKNLLRKMNQGYRSSQPLILLPQALGPFNQPDVARACRGLFERASLVCARDTKSYEHAKRLAAPPKLQRFPDFTLGVEPDHDHGVEVPERFQAVVPNMRMLDKSEQSASYLDILRSAVDQVRACGGNPVFVIHDAQEDAQVPKLMGPEYSAVPVITHSDPRALKSILGRADFVIGSRFHALVSALSQGVPCIGLGWSHKYPELFADFGCRDLLIEDLNDEAQVAATISRLMSPQARGEIAATISASARTLRLRLDALWELVFSHIDGTLKCRQ